MSNTYSFLDVNAGIVGPGGAFSLGNGAGVAEEGISITATEDISAMTIGADGTGMHSLHADKSGVLTVRVLKTSPVNQLLMNLYNFQTASGAAHGQNTIAINDKSRGDAIICTQAAFKKVPDLTFAKDGGTNEWTFNVIRIERTLGS